MSKRESSKIAIWLKCTHFKRFSVPTPILKFTLFSEIFDWYNNESTILKKELFTESTLAIIDKLLSNELSF